MSSLDPQSKPASARFRLFTPILAGATLRERLLACLGALISIAVTGMIGGYFFGDGIDLPLIVAPMGASAVLLFAVPASPLAQPWSIIGGNTISALMGVFAAHVVHDPVIAIGVGVSLAIAAMSFTRSLHPPGGAAALTAVLGGPAVAHWGLLFPLIPVALNSCVLVALGIAFHKLSWRSYPHVAAPVAANLHGTTDLPSDRRVGFNEQDIDAALVNLDESFDIDRGDLGRLLRQVEFESLVRSNGKILCRDIMSQDVISIEESGTTEDARALLLKHNIRTLPVRSDDGRLIGTLGLRELAHASVSFKDHISPAATASAGDKALSLLPVLTDGHTHAVIIIDAELKILGLISQTDLLSAVARALPAGQSDNRAA
ncbi:CBS domain-containing protein [Rhizobium lusitanum]|uniref:CBS domain-containing protein n=1 Tax=Rhizobium lusitanum TaxID=293958 RepID=A0A6L9U7K4_9HYPH|nr:HPP family protein [Rhizobium lusitanum]NEI71923.1 CBS domain-containing protein [Rhizobium lusitanum]